MEYHAKSGLLFKRMELFTMKPFAAITRPAVMRMGSLEKQGSYTTLTLDRLEPEKVPLQVFSKNYLTRRGG